MTGRATSVMVSIPLLGFISWWLGYPVVAILAASLLIMLGVAALFVVRPPSRGIKRSVEPHRVTRGEAAQVRLWKRNLSPMPSIPLDATDRIGHLTVDLTIPATRPGGRAEAVYRFVTTRRGHLDVGPVELSRRDPWGLFHRTRDTGEIQEISVYPRILSVAAPDIVHRLTRDAGAADVAAGSDRFHTLREYVTGDELRKVHWPSSARTGTLMVKQMVDSPRPKLLLYLDCTAGEYSDDEAFEQAVDATVSLAHAIAATGVQLAVAAGHQQIVTEINRRADLDTMLESFVSVSVETRSASASLLRSIVGQTRATGVVAVTGCGPSFTAVLGGLRSVVGQSFVYRIGCPKRGRVIRRDLHVYDFTTADELSEVHPGRPRGTA